MHGMELCKRIGREFLRVLLHTYAYFFYATPESYVSCRLLFYSLLLFLGNDHLTCKATDIHGMDAK